MRARVGKRLLLLAVGGTLLLGLGGCVYGPGYYDRYDRYDRYGDSGYDDNYYDGYYDGYYGPFIGGYWASDNYFYYWGPNQRYHRDDGRHFRREHFQGAKPFHGDRGRRDGDRRDHRGDRRGH